MAEFNGEWLERNFPCKWACPVHTEAGKYVTLIAQGRYREAYAVARRPNPLASICGRICGAPCESVCRRGELDAPIAIRALKRFVTERFGVESMMDFSVLTEIYGERRGRYSERIAVIGSGPAGLACAHDLALMGYPVTIFEASPVAGGMLRLGVPEYRLPRALIQLEVNAILSLGVELKTNARLGRDFTLADLKQQGFSAIFLGVGAMRSRELTIPGVELDGVLRGIDYLLNINLGYKVEMGQHVVVIGGGNVALDVARTAARGGEQANLQRNLSIVQALDVARSAIRFGARKVTVCSLESESEMPAAREEMEEAEKEGIRFLHRVGPKRLVGGKGTVTGIEFLEVSRVFDETGRFSPQFIDGSETLFPTDTVIIAIGQTGDFSFLQPQDGIETRAGRILIDPDTLATTAPGVWAGGDAAFGPRIAINAIADGKISLEVSLLATACRRARDVQGHVAAPDDDHVLTHLDLVAEVDVEQVIDPPQHAVELDSRDRQFAAAHCADSQEDRGEALLFQVRQREVAAESSVGLQLDAQRENGVHLELDQGPREAVLRDSEAEHAARDR